MAVEMIMRESWDEYFMRLAFEVSKRSTCLRRRVGALAVKDRHILATGYNGAPAGVPHCDKYGCIREALNVPSGERHELCRAVHAEQNVIAQAARFGVSLDGCTIYCTTSPCVICSKLMVNAGVKRVVIREEYPDKKAHSFLYQAGVEIVRVGEDDKGTA